MAAACSAAVGSRQNRAKAWSNTSWCSCRWIITARSAVRVSVLLPSSISDRACCAASVSAGPTGNPARRSRRAKCMTLAASVGAASVGAASVGAAREGEGAFVMAGYCGNSWTLQEAWSRRNVGRDHDATDQQCHATRARHSPAPCLGLVQEGPCSCAGKPVGAGPGMDRPSASIFNLPAGDRDHATSSRHCAAGVWAKPERRLEPAIEQPGLRCRQSEERSNAANPGMTSPGMFVTHRIIPGARKTDAPTVPTSSCRRRPGGGRHPRLSLVRTAKSWMAGLRPP